MPDGKQREALVRESQVAENPGQCPACGSTSVLLEGKYQRKFVKEVREGEVVRTEPGRGFVERYTAIVCLKCKVRSEIEPDHVVALFLDNMNLRMRQAELDGLPVRRPGKKELVM